MREINFFQPKFTPDPAVLRGLQSFLQYKDSETVRDKSSVTQAVSIQRSVADELSHSAMDLKIAVAPYAMHLSFEQRHRIFDEIDFLLDFDGWDEDDARPEQISFVNFLKWAVETKADHWASLSLDGDGNTSVSFLNEENVLTAAFLPDGTVEWASRLVLDDGVDAAAGKSPLKSFAAVSPALLGRL